MQYELVEKRKYKRLLFSTKKSVAASIMKNSNPEAVIPVTVLNLSEGGLGLASTKDMLHVLFENEELKLTHIESQIDLSFLIGRKLKVRWLLKNPLLDHLCFACEFLDLPPSNLKMIRNIVDSCDDNQ